MKKIPEKKATQNEQKKILSILSCVTDKEWDEIITRCKKGIEHRLWLTEYGAHSEAELGEPADIFYIRKAIEKVYSFEWSWDYEQISIAEHLITIANTLISNQLDHYRRKQKREEKVIVFNDELYYDAFEDVYDERIDQLIECIERLTAGMDDLGFYWEAIKEGKKSREIAELMELPVKAIYKKNDKLIYQARKNCLKN
ncbi:MAG: RNA polymerase sigma factor [bacterium]